MTRKIFSATLKGGKRQTDLKINIREKVKI